MESKPKSPEWGGRRTAGPGKSLGRKPKYGRSLNRPTTIRLRPDQIQFLLGPDGEADLSERIRDLIDAAMKKESHAEPHL